jgi:protein TonB
MVNAICGFNQEQHLIANGAGFDFNFFTTKPTSMNSELIMNSDVLDILFEKRNKEYGAYTLRKYYNSRLIKSMSIMIAGVTVFSAFTFLPVSSKRDDFGVTDAVFGQILPDKKNPAVKPKIVKPATKRPISTLKWVSAVHLVDNTDSADFLRNLINRTIGSNTTTEEKEEFSQFAGTPGTGNGEITEPAKSLIPMVDIIKPVDFAEIMPEFPGGIAALRKYLLRNLTNPRELEQGELISVKIKFVVGFDGKLQNFELVENGDNEFNAEVMRVLKKMPVWTPGKSNGQNVSVYYVIPVKFVSED